MNKPKFHVGQAVVLIDDQWSGRDEEKPKRGPIYHVRNHSICNREWHIRLKEVHNGPRRYEDGFCECAFNEKRFAPAEYASDEALAELLEEVFTPVTA